jgi:hypothetical protein
MAGTADMSSNTTFAQRRGAVSGRPGFTIGEPAQRVARTTVRQTSLLAVFVIFGVILLALGAASTMFLDRATPLMDFAVETSGTGAAGDSGSLTPPISLPTRTSFDNVKAFRKSKSGKIASTATQLLAMAIACDNDRARTFLRHVIDTITEVSAFDTETEFRKAMQRNPKRFKMSERQCKYGLPAALTALRTQL